LAEDLLARGQSDLAETFIDASFSGAKKWGQLVQHATGKGSEIMAIAVPPWVFLSPWGGMRFALMKPSSSSPRPNFGSSEKGRKAGLSKEE
jgi:hypothetical protein